MIQREYYTSDEVSDLVKDFDDLREYLYGWKDAIVKQENNDEFFKKEYVDLYVNR